MASLDYGMPTDVYIRIGQRHSHLTPLRQRLIAAINNTTNAIVSAKPRTRPVMGPPTSDRRRYVIGPHDRLRGRTANNAMTTAATAIQSVTSRQYPPRHTRQSSVGR